MFLNSLKDRAITSCPALLISAPASGQGKTTLAAAMARYHARRGRKVRVFKTGPDFIDPMFLEKASGHPVYQLDLWMVGEEACRQLLFDTARWLEEMGKDWRVATHVDIEQFARDDGKDSQNKHIDLRPRAVFTNL